MAGDLKEYCLSEASKQQGKCLLFAMITEQCFSDCGRSINTWELVRNAKTQAPLDPLHQKLSGGRGVFQQPFR